MKILAVDTALGACSVAVLDGEAVLAHRFEFMERGHAEALAPMVQASMREADIRFGDLERLAVTTGPGTFTGQRVGMALMRGLRVALKLPLIGITTLEAMARAAMKEAGAPLGAALHDAKRGEVYAALYMDDAALLEPLLLPLGDAVQSIWDSVGKRGEMLGFAGTAASEARERWMALGGTADVTGIIAPDALWVARIAAMTTPTGDAPRPLYLRPPDARLPVGPA
ncbi:MAG TPA: tRNA (adenosine(37)-N6)-threonylcarbamoyltransferase complex dimerization subunit type 1 TsaB [Rhizomicrobium sp.]|jgi:tRNA threonylcarbamoyladenosine biosynthesis protein TsaB|nr:tRNA (adenosine(37)-N6)-threonylcarbamoyltransferase complex dimerization subunit type 1 TsaB [Rhizomicrobium sp.]